MVYHSWSPLYYISNETTFYDRHHFLVLDIRCFPNGTIVVPNLGGHFNKVDVESKTCRLRGSEMHEELWLDNCQMVSGIYKIVR